MTIRPERPRRPEAARQPAAADRQDRGGGRAARRRSSRRRPTLVEVARAARHGLQPPEAAPRTRSASGRSSIALNAAERRRSSKGEADGATSRDVTATDALAIWRAGCSLVSGGQSCRAVDARAGPGQTQAAAKPPKPKPAPSRSAEFDKLVKAATEARQAERWERGDRALRKAVKLKPDYVEGYWYQGTAYYTLDNYHAVPRRVPEGRHASRRRTAPAYAFLGLCEFGLKEYDRSLQHLLQSRDLGVGDVARSRQRGALPRRAPDDAHGSVRAGARDARRVRQRRATTTRG